MSKRVRVAALGGAATAALLVAAPRPAEAQERPGWYGSLEGRYLMSDGDKTSDSDVFQSVTSSVRPAGDGGGGAVSLGYRFASPWDVQFALSDNQLGEAKSSSPLVALHGGVSEQMKATASTDYYLLDFDAGYNLVLGGMDLRLSGGARYAHFNETYHGVFSYLYGSHLSYDHYRRVKFSGWGPLLGARARMPLGESRFAIIAAGGASALFGNLTNTSFEANLRTTTGVYELEGALSLAYRIDVSWDAEIGYRAEQWWNVVDTRPDLNSTGNRTNGNLLTNGPFVRVDLHF
jgi:opacity protein-like surface antigen